MPSDAAQPIVRLSRVSKSFGAFRALNAVDFTARPGERVVVCGPSGSGKSTLIRCINGLETPEAGTVTVDGTVLTPATGSPASCSASRRSSATVLLIPKAPLPESRFRT